MRWEEAQKRGPGAKACGDVTGRPVSFEARKGAAVLHLSLLLLQSMFKPMVVQNEEINHGTAQYY